MRTILLFCFMCVGLFSLAQIPPEAFNYSAVIRGSNNQALPNSVVSIRFSILKGGPAGTVQYQEIHTDTTNQWGLITLQIGLGQPVQGSFSTINWGSDSYYLQTELDDNGGTTFQNMGTEKFLSVPYALYSGTAANANCADTSNTNELQVLTISNDTIFLSNGGFVILPAAFNGTNTDNQTLSINSDTLSISGGNSIVIPADKRKITYNNRANINGGDSIGCYGIAYWDLPCSYREYSVISTSSGYLKNLYAAVVNGAVAVGAVVKIAVYKNGLPTGLSLILTSSDGVAVKTNTSVNIHVDEGDFIGFVISESQGVDPGTSFQFSVDLEY